MKGNRIFSKADHDCIFGDRKFDFVKVIKSQNHNQKSIRVSQTVRILTNRFHKTSKIKVFLKQNIFIMNIFHISYISNYELLTTDLY